jgi:hypothetical protein
MWVWRGRYAFGGSVLWPEKKPPQPAKCPHCGHRRHFELQLAPYLQVAFNEDGEDDSARPTDQWDWSASSLSQ